MPTYETIFITVPNITEDDERATVETLAQIVTDGGGSMVTRDRMGRRRLAYPIRKFEDGVYTRLLYDSDAAVPRELERRFRLSENVLRYLTVCLEKEWAVQAKEDAVRDAKRRAEAEAAAVAAAIEAAKEEAAKAEAAKEETAKQAAEEQEKGEADPAPEAEASAPAESVAANETQEAEAAPEEPAEEANAEATKES